MGDAAFLDDIAAFCCLKMLVDRDGDDLGDCRPADQIFRPVVHVQSHKIVFLYPRVYKQVGGLPDQNPHF